MFRSAMTSLLHNLLPTRRVSAVRSTLLFARPSFVYGFAKAFDPMRVTSDFNRSRTPEEADILAIRSDWHAIGADMQEAVEQERGQSPRERYQARQPAHTFAA